ncbi:Adenylate kinase isoenzyme 6-like protein [Bienertia sinuspersici]
MSSALAEATQLCHVNIGELVKEKNLHDGWDAELDCHIINEDLVCDELEDMMEEGGVIVEYHGCDFSLSVGLIVLSGYAGSKLTNNIECEIFQVLFERLKIVYREDIVVAMKNDSIDDINKNVADLSEWVSSWVQINQCIMIAWAIKVVEYLR